MRKYLIFFLVAFALQALAADKQGHNANKYGRALEKKIWHAFESKGFHVMLESKYLKNTKKYSNIDKLLLRHVRYTTVYGHRGYTEFLMLCRVCKVNKLRIEAKEQRVAGSKDEALVYVYANALEATPDNHFMLVYSGTGFKEGAIEWVKNAAKTKKWATVDNHDKVIEVKSYDEFLDWIELVSVN